MSSLRSGTSSSTMGIFTLIACCFVGANALTRGYYRAAVVDYASTWNSSLNAQDNLMANVNSYATLMSTVGTTYGQIDIFVFPEGGLQGWNTSQPLLVPSPASNSRPYNNSQFHPALQQLSYLAITYKTYLIVNVYEMDTVNNATVKYDTNVAFDRNGTVVGRYRKYNMVAISGLTAPAKLEPSYFTTDFNVTIGQLVTDDLLFKEPFSTMTKKNITDFVYSSRWMNQLPFLLSVQAQWMWSYGNKVNLMASGVNDLANGYIGSGIYQGLTGQNQFYVLDNLTGNTVRINDIPIPGCTGSGCSSGNGAASIQSGTTPGNPKVFAQSLAQNVSELVTLPTNYSAGAQLVAFNENLCHNTLCCTFNLSLTYTGYSSNVTVMRYRAVVFDGTTTLGSSQSLIGLQICAVIACANSSLSSCGALFNNSFVIPSTQQITFNQVSVSGNFIKNDAQVLPNILLWPTASLSFLLNYSQVNFTLSGTDGLTHIATSNNQILTVGIHSRLFSRDGTSTSSSYQTTVSVLTLLLPAFVISKLIVSKQS